MIDIEDTTLLSLLFLGLDQFSDASDEALQTAGESIKHYAAWRENVIIWKSVGESMRKEIARLGLPEEAYPLPYHTVSRSDYQFLQGALDRVKSLYREALSKQDIMGASILDASTQAVRAMVEELA